jgi:hypothetical protein
LSPGVEGQLGQHSKQDLSQKRKEKKRKLEEKRWLGFLTRLPGFL